ncbi:hypothetical protein BDW69DRAFT_186438 [Aspergillus filifer]
MGSTMSVPACCFAGVHLQDSDGEDRKDMGPVSRNPLLHRSHLDLAGYRANPYIFQDDSQGTPTRRDTQKSGPVLKSDNSNRLSVNSMRRTETHSQNILKFRHTESDYAQEIKARTKSKTTSSKLIFDGKMNAIIHN